VISRQQPGVGMNAGDALTAPFKPLDVDAEAERRP